MHVTRKVREGNGGLLSDVVRRHGQAKVHVASHGNGHVGVLVGPRPRRSGVVHRPVGREHVPLPDEPRPVELVSQIRDVMLADTVRPGDLPTLQRETRIPVRRGAQHRHVATAVVKRFARHDPSLAPRVRAADIRADAAVDVEVAGDRAAGKVALVPRSPDVCAAAREGPGTVGFARVAEHAAHANVETLESTIRPGLRRQPARIGMEVTVGQRPQRVRVAPRRVIRSPVRVAPVDHDVRRISQRHVAGEPRVPRPRRGPGVLDRGSGERPEHLCARPDVRSRVARSETVDVRASRSQPGHGAGIRDRHGRGVRAVVGAVRPGQIRAFVRRAPIRPHLRRRGPRPRERRVDPRAGRVDARGPVGRTDAGLVHRGEERGEPDALQALDVRRNRPRIAELRRNRLDIVAAGHSNQESRPVAALLRSLRVPAKPPALAVRQHVGSVQTPALPIHRPLAVAAVAIVVEQRAEEEIVVVVRRGDPAVVVQEAKPIPFQFRIPAEGRQDRRVDVVSAGIVQADVLADLRELDDRNRRPVLYVIDRGARVQVALDLQRLVGNGRLDDHGQRRRTLHAGHVVGVAAQVYRGGRPRDLGASQRQALADQRASAGRECGESTVSVAHDQVMPGCLEGDARGVPPRVVPERTGVEFVLLDVGNGGVGPAVRTGRVQQGQSQPAVVPGVIEFEELDAGGVRFADDAVSIGVGTERMQQHGIAISCHLDDTPACCHARELAVVPPDVPLRPPDGNIGAGQPQMRLDLGAVVAVVARVVETRTVQHEMVPCGTQDVRRVARQDVRIRIDAHGRIPVVCEAVRRDVVGSRNLPEDGDVSRVAPGHTARNGKIETKEQEEWESRCSHHYPRG